ncbi:MAG: tRNA (adenosine(37)-N6)-threonylcarbamoyltransferase complex dimerization subunit type 1 TsaB [Chloroflexota bacterium]
MNLVVDTATQRPVVGLADEIGRLVGEQQWTSRHRHGEELLGRIDELLISANIARRALGGVICGTGPGSFTGLRIGLATAKTIAYALAVPLVGVSTTRALARAALTADSTLRELTVWLPAGAADRYVQRFRVVDGEPREAGAPKLTVAQPTADEIVGEEVDGLAAALATLGARALAAGKTDDPHTLVPAYVALPRGIARAAAEMTWSPDLR